MESECRMQRRKPLGEKILEKIRGNPALPSREKKTQYFGIPTSEDPAIFQKPKTALKVQFSVMKKNQEVRK